MRYAQRYALSCLALVVVAMVPAARAQQAASDVVRWSVAPVRVAPGHTAPVALDATIDDGWQMYALPAADDDGAGPFPLTLEWASLPEHVHVAGAPREEGVATGYDPNFDANVRYFVGNARVLVPLAVDSTAASGDVAVAGQVSFQTCNHEQGICLPPAHTSLTATLVVDPSCGEGCDEVAATTKRLDRAVPAAPVDAGGGFWAFLLLAAGAGLATLLTPCVFPMIPLTVSYFSSHAGDRREAVAMAAVYGASIVLTFTGLGLVTSLLLGAAGAHAIAANPWVNLAIGGVLVVFALSLLGMFELRLPSGLLNYTNRQGNTRAGVAGVVFMGLTLTLVSFSCTAPFVGGLLAGAAGGAWTYPLLGMFIYSGTFAAPFVLLAVFPRWLQALPRSGSWMVTVKVVLGFVELAAAVKFVSNADLLWGWGFFTRPLVIAFTSVTLFALALYLLGKLRLPHTEDLAYVGAGRLTAALASGGFALYLLSGLAGARLPLVDAYLPPASTSTAIKPKTEVDWHTDDLEGAMAEARANGKLLFVDFSGYTCTNCRAMETNVLPDPGVDGRLTKGFVRLRLYTDGLEQGDAFQAYEVRLTGSAALPTYAVVDPASERLVAVTRGLMTKDAFAGFLDDSLERTAQM